MFFYIQGKLAYYDLNTCVIDCGGVGYKLTVSQITSQSLSSKNGENVKLFTHLAVREDGIELFGFGNDEERSCFNQLISVSGVGPKVAMGILSVMTPEQLIMAVCSENVKAISKAPGVGSKTAARIVLELKDKMGKSFSMHDVLTATKSVVNASANANSNAKEAMEALTVLGYDRSTVLKIVSEIDTSANEVGEIIRLALKKLSR